jgi:hypothetical protein
MFFDIKMFTFSKNCLIDWAPKNAHDVTISYHVLSNYLSQNNRYNNSNIYLFIYLFALHLSFTGAVPQT